MIPRRGFGYYCTLIGRYYLIGSPGILLDAIVRWLCPFVMRSGIRVLDPTPETRKHFTTVVDAAVELIAQFDRIRFRRVQAQIRAILRE